MSLMRWKFDAATYGSILPVWEAEGLAERKR